MKFQEFSQFLEKLEQTSSRNEITQILAELFKNLQKDEVSNATYLLLGQLAPSYKSVIFSMADKMVVRAIAYAFSEDDGVVNKLYKTSGDLGVAAYELARKKIKNNASTFSINDVFQKLFLVAKYSGEGSQDEKINGFGDFVKQLDPLSVKFAVRIPLGKLRLGFSDKTIIDALSWMVTGDKSESSKIEKAYQVLPDVGLLAQKIKENGVIKTVKNISPVVGVPVLPMLAQRIKSPSEMIEKMEAVSVEPKLDGLRLSIHFKKGKEVLTKAYTRNLKDNSWMFPELAQMEKYINADSVILDCEAVGLDETTKQMANFQTTMTRRRKHEIDETLAKVGIEFFCFDILSKNGKSLMDDSYETRRAELEKTIKPGGPFKVVDFEKTNNPKRIAEICRIKINSGLEGIIVKKISSTYVPGRTGWRWVKMKQDESLESKLADTVDAVVMGYTLGKGKRADFGLGQFLVGVLDGETIKTTTKIGTGLTDEQFRELKKRLTPLEVKEMPREYVVQKNYTPDFWVKPSLVVEIGADEITKSPTHSSGLALRFPRLINFRDDKSPNEATTTKELESLFKLQKSN